MNFDYVIMNPPWNRKVALPILERSLQITKNLVTIQPINTIQKNISDHRDKYEKTIGTYLEKIDLVNSSVFNVAADGDVAVMKFSQTGGYDWNSLSILDKTEKAQKVFSKIQDLESIRDYAKRKQIGKYSLVIPSRHGHFRADGANGGKCWDYYDLFSREKESSATAGVTIYFDTKIEKENFKKSIFSSRYKYIISLYKKTTNSSLSLYPMMKDYKQEWNDSEYDKFFGWTNEEQKEIETLMEPFK